MRRTVLTLLAIPALGAALTLGAAPAAAQTLADYDYVHLRFRGVGLGAGYLWSGRIEDTEEYSLRIDLGYLGPGVRIVPSLTYWSSELAQPEIDELATRLSQHTGALITGDELAPIQWSDLSFSVDGHFVWSTPVGLMTFVGVGLGLHALNGQGAAVEGTFVEDLLDDITAGANGMAGLELQPTERFRFYAEARYTLMNSLRYATLRGGVQLMFSQGGVEVGAVAPPPPPALEAP